MRKWIFNLACFLLLSSTISAQDAYSFYKKAKKSYDKYQQTEDSEKLWAALEDIEKALRNVDQEGAKKATKIWMKAGEVYNEIALEDYKIFLVNNNHRPIHPKSSRKAFDAYRSAINSADKKWDRSKALDELLKTATFISNEGIVAYNIENYESAFESFTMIIDIKRFLSIQGHNSILNKKKDYQEHLFKTALAAQRADHPGEAIDYFEQLAEVKFDHPAIYSSLSQLYKLQGNKPRSLTKLQIGRELFPEDEGLMIAEINHYLENDQLDILTEKLEAAIQQSPHNVSLYSTMGHVYNELQKAETNKGNLTLAQSYFQQALDHFTKALDLDGSYTPALYNMGALYYNNAAMLTKEIKSVELDQTGKGIRNTNTKRMKMLQVLDQALPYFQKAEAINPNDRATLEALKEIYTRKKDQTLVSEFSARLDQLQAGKTLEKGYFNQKF